ncbi:MAG: hypothetical protein PHD03_04695 [Bacilli bacterium]|nr:hypothetical protein [Bacilli bacterium]
MHKFKNVFINDYYSLAGPLEKNSNLKKCDYFIDDYYFGEKTPEKAESKMQKIVIKNLIKNEKPDLIIGSDLNNQLTATALSVVDLKIPYIGHYCACASSASMLITLANFIMSKNIKRGLFIISSHTLVAEKQFRFPVEYGAPKPIRSSQTATAAVGIIVSNQESKIKIVSGLLGKVIDSGIKDAYNMGAIMAPSAVDTLITFLNKSKTTVKDYDLILTGDLGKVGSEIFKAVLQKEYNIKINNHLDGGATLYKNIEYSGASGPAVLPLTLVTKILTNNKYKKILYLATGTLHSTLLVNQKNSIPTLTHAVYLEVGL